MKIRTPHSNCPGKTIGRDARQAGFSLIEVVIAMSVFLVVMLGITSVLVYSVNYNAGNNTRIQALNILQQEIERLRFVKFDLYGADALLDGGIHAERLVETFDGRSYSVVVLVDDDPNTAGIQADPSRSLKEITITVAPTRSTPGWQTALPVTSVFQRARTN